MSRGPRLRLARGPGLRRRHHLDHDRPRHTARARSSLATTAARSPNTARTRSRSCASSRSIATPPTAIPDKQSVPADLHRAARDIWDETLALGTAYGYPQRADHPARSDRHHRVHEGIAIPPASSPTSPWSNTQKLVGEGFLKIVNQTVPGALRKLGYTSEQVDAIVAYVNERETIEGAPELRPRAPFGLRLRLQADERHALHPLHGPPADDVRGPAIPLGRDQQDREHCPRRPRPRRSSRSTSRAGVWASRRSRSTATTRSAHSPLMTRRRRRTRRLRRAAPIAARLRLSRSP